MPVAFTSVGAALVGAALWKRLPSSALPSAGGVAPSVVVSRWCGDVLQWVHVAMEAVMRLALSQDAVADALSTVDVYDGFLHRYGGGAAAGSRSSEMASGVPSLTSTGAERCLPLLALTAAVVSVHTATMSVALVLDKLEAMQVIAAGRVGVCVCV